MKCKIFGAGSDLGVHIDGSSLGPVQLINDIKGFFSGEIYIQKQEENIIKSKNLSDRRKNEYELDKFNNKLYQLILDNTKEDCFPITIGGDHSTSIASSLADLNRNPGLGLIWISAHGDYHTFNTTTTGNIHGLSLAAITGYKNNELSYFNKTYFQPARSVLFGTREIDNSEFDNTRYANINVMSDKDIKEKGLENALEEAFKLALDKTEGIHVCLNLDIIDPGYAPGVNIPVFDGLNEEDVMKINEILIKHINEITAIDIMEFNPLRDSNRKTEQIAINIIYQLMKASETKEKYVRKKY